MDKTQIPIRGLSIQVEQEGEKHLPTIVFLHGFTGSTSTWKDVRSYFKGEFRTIAIDLTGHGKTSIPEDPTRYTMEEQIKDLHCIFSQLSLESFYLVGYSMGGRIALAYTIEYSEQVRGLVLESSSPGLEEYQDRITRKQADEDLAKRIMKDGITDFVNKWENIPLFNSQKQLPHEQRQLIRNERLQQSEIGLANSLIGIGTGSQQSYWNDLSTIENDVLLITGELDEKFVTIAREMIKFAPSWERMVVPGAGHAIHVEKPRLFATMIKDYIQGLQQKLEEE